MKFLARHLLGLCIVLSYRGTYDLSNGPNDVHCMKSSLARGMTHFSVFEGIRVSNLSTCIGF